MACFIPLFLNIYVYQSICSTISKAMGASIIINIDG